MAILSGAEVKGFEFVQYGRPFVKFEVNSIAATTVGSNRYVNMDGFFVGASGVATQIVPNTILTPLPASNLVFYNPNLSNAILVNVPAHLQINHLLIFLAYQLIID